MNNTRGVALVTGGGSGLGLAIARELGAAGWSVGLVGRSERRLAQAAADLGAGGCRAAYAAADVREDTALATAVAGLEAELGPIDVAVHAAGVMSAIGPVWEQDEAAWRADLDTSALGAFLVVRNVAPGMIARRRGRLVLIASGVAARASPYRAAYAAGKAALLCLTEALAAELAPFEVAVVAIAPGFVETDMTARMVGTPWFANLAESPAIPAEDTARLVGRIAAGEADPLSGRLLHPFDDLDALLARADEIVNDELYVARVRRLEPLP